MQIRRRALAGATERRTWPWFVGMVTSPDSMTAHDPEAKQRFAEFLVQMPALGATQEDARARRNIA